ncbi:reticulon-2 isoform X2 [Rana temporaria]|uniref:reticulon-2 isoform X2 n=1 Tax=Rana temporaria TaxID=8407 RepID=UPI001AAC76D3|nr:reticulon-2 isoform X2 [Rana temporaria]
MGHVLSFTHCKDAPSTTSSTPDSCPPDDDVDDTAVTLADLWPLPSPQEPTFSYITIGSSIPIARPPARGRRGRGLGRGQGTRNEEPGEDIVSFVLLEKVCHMTQALPPLIGHEEMTFMERPQPRLDLHQTQPRLDLHQTQPRLDLHQTQPRLDLHQTQPRLDLHQLQPRPDLHQPQPRLDLHQTQPRPNLHQPQPRPDLHTVGEKNELYIA